MIVKTLEIVFVRHLAYTNLSTLSKKKNVKMLYRNLPFLFVGYDVFYCECGRSFDTLTTYEQHCKSDHGEQQYPFKCPICSKRIQHLTSMKRHMTASHSDHRPFGCSLCQKTFKRKDVLTQHLFNVHKIRKGKTAM